MNLLFRFKGREKWPPEVAIYASFNRFSLRTFLCHIWHMSFLTGQDRTPKFVGQVQPDWTESGLIFLTFYLTSISYQFSYDKIPGHKFSIKKSILGNIWKSTKKSLEKKKIKICLKIFFIFYFKRVKTPVSGKENVWFPDSPYFEILPDFRTGRDVRY